MSLFLDGEEKRGGGTDVRIGEQTRTLPDPPPSSPRRHPHQTGGSRFAHKTRKNPTETSPAAQVNIKSLQTLACSVLEA